MGGDAFCAHISMSPGRLLVILSTCSLIAPFGWCGQFLSFNACVRHVDRTKTFAVSRYTALLHPLFYSRDCRVTLTAKNRECGLACFSLFQHACFLSLKASIV